MRIYDTRLARFLSIDPIFRKYPELSPYQFASNRPIEGVDQDGLEFIGSTGIPSFVKLKEEPKESVRIPYALPKNPSGTVLTVGTDGYTQTCHITVHKIPALEHGQLNGVKGIVLHRTVSTNTQGTLNSFGSKGVGTHFLVGKDGEILQTASLNKKTSHVRESQLVPWAPGNASSIGIEVVGMYDKATKTWDPVTPSQEKSVAFLTNSLLKTYNLEPWNVRNHEDIQPKTAGEGRTVMNAIKKYLPTETSATPSPSQGDDLHKP